LIAINVDLILSCQMEFNYLPRNLWRDFRKPNHCKPFPWVEHKGEKTENKQSSRKKMRVGG
jgi:hypothetical protein